MELDDMEADVGALAAVLSKKGNKRYRRYQLKCIRPTDVIRDELDRIFDLVMSEVCGTELEPDDKDGTFFDYINLGDERSESADHRDRRSLPGNVPRARLGRL